MGEKIMATIINDKGNDYAEEWINLPVEQREKACLMVSYDMGWKKRF